MTKIKINDDALGDQKSKIGGFAVNNIINYDYLLSNEQKQQDDDNHYTYYVYKIEDSKVSYAISKDIERNEKVLFAKDSYNYLNENIL